jgi:hypothetical protein
MTDGDVAAFAFGLEAVIKGADGGPRGVPEVSAHEIVAFAGHRERAGRQGMALLVDAGAVLLGKDAEVVDQLGGRRQAVDVHDLGDQDRGRGLADSGDGDDLDVGRAGQVSEGSGQQLPEALLGVLAATYLSYQLADQRLGHGAAQRRHRLLRGLVQRLGLVEGQMRDFLQGVAVGLGDALGGGILVKKPQYPAGGDVVSQGGKFRECAGQEVVESVDGLGRLFDLGL